MTFNHRVVYTNVLANNLRLHSQRALHRATCTTGLNVQLHFTHIDRYVLSGSNCLCSKDSPGMEECGSFSLSFCLFSLCNLLFFFLSLSNSYPLQFPLRACGAFPLYLHARSCGCGSSSTVCLNLK